MSRRFPVMILGWLLAVAWAGAGGADDRPSLEQMKTANCAWASLQGSYRPFYCDAQCPCAGNVPPGTACVETAPGDYAFQWSDLEQCIQTQEACVDGGALGFYCKSDPFVVSFGGSCTTSADCPAGYSCTGIFDPPNTCYQIVDPGTPCTTSADCSSVDVCDDPGRTTCVTDLDCSGGDTCQLDGSCGRGCTTNNDCVTATTTVTITGVSAPEATTAASCNGLPSNHKDARLCLAQLGCDLCGDGYLDSGEGCDDGNTTPGDGCDATCQSE